MEYLQNLDFSILEKSWSYLFITGMKFTISLTVVAALGGLFFGSILVVMRLSGNPFVAGTSKAIVNLIRTVPIVLGIFFFYFMMPYVGAWITGSERPVQVGAVASAYVAFMVFEAAYFAEIMRAGVQSISTGQMNAGKALGLSYIQIMRLILLPQAFRRMLPAILTQTIVLFQDTSLVYVLSLTDFVGAASKIAQRDNRMVEMYLFVAATYFIICFMCSTMVNKLKRKVAA
ncbi:Glutamate/aspartate transport system permease protein GltK [Pseudomonas sp. AD21]|uniref:amino acid ABC transporter permease n=1 Tax=Pseudomonas sp. AD21 TaxID=396378 RepID=UPI000C82F9B0|nr:amino acid ABC transporter permease [Pseudomonas sp. AD21]PMQ11568.1 Glutamate/aspartate transport system permease protein GltK [Pseudomonas sp. AD21]